MIIAVIAAIILGIYYFSGSKKLASENFSPAAGSVNKVYSNEQAGINRSVERYKFENVSGTFGRMTEIEYTIKNDRATAIKPIVRLTVSDYGLVNTKDVDSLDVLGSGQSIHKTLALDFSLGRINYAKEVELGVYELDPVHLTENFVSSVSFETNLSKGFN